MAQEVKCLPHKHEDLSVDFKNPREKVGVELQVDERPCLKI